MRSVLEKIVVLRLRAAGNVVHLLAYLDHSIAEPFKAKLVNLRSSAE